MVSAGVPVRKAGVVGWPVGHSLSPVIHATWAAREGRQIAYEAIPVEPSYDTFKAAIERLILEGYAGVNVTLPHKERAMGLCDDASEEARAAGAANMLTFSGRRIHAHNSDIAGFAASLEEAGVRPRTALVLGGGGAARGVAIALKRLAGARKIMIANRTAHRARHLALLVDGEAIDWEARSDAVGGVDLLVNATSLGMTGEAPLDIDLARLPRGAAVADIVYSPLETPLLAAARARGATLVDGLSMLMHQAAIGYRAWLGSTAVVDAELRARLVAALKAREGR
ncbi:MAG: shikimate dehydrogenase [Parvularculaceae bacterium]